MSWHESSPPFYSSNISNIYDNIAIDTIYSHTEDGSRYKGLVDAVTKIYTQEGLLAFWTGFGAYYMRTAPHAMIILMTTQPITDHYKRTFKL